MAQKDAIYNLILNLDKSEYSGALGGVQNLAKEIVELARKTDRTSAEAEELSQKIVEIGKDANFQAMARELELLNIGDEIAAGFTRAERAAQSIGDAQGGIAQVANEMTRAATAAERLDLADEQFDVLSRRVGLAGDLQSNVGAIRGIADLSGAEGTAAAIGIASEIAVLAEELPRLKLAIQNMPDVIRIAAQSIGGKGLGLIGSMALLAAGTVYLTSKFQEASKYAAQVADVQQNVTTFLATATSDEIQARVDELTQKNEALTASQGELARTYEGLREGIRDADIYGVGLGKVGLAIADLGSEVGLTAGELESYEDKIKENKDAISANKLELDILTAALEKNANATNDAYEAIEQNAEENVRFIEENAARQSELNRLIAEGDAQTLQDRLDGIELESQRVNKILTDLRQLPQTEAVTNAIADYESQLSNLNSELILFSTYATPAIEAREQENAALEATRELINQRVANLLEGAQEELEFSRFVKDATLEQVQERITAIEEERDALTAILPELERLAPRSDEAARQLALVREQITDLGGDLNRLEGQGIASAIANEQLQLTEEILDIEEERDERIAEIRRETVDREAELLRSLNDELSKLEADATEKREKAYGDYNEKARQIEEDAFNKRLEIIKRYARDSTKAIGDRDALALEMAKQQKNESLDDLDASIADQRKKLEDGYAKQLLTIDQELNKQRTTLQSKYNQQLSDLRTQAQAEIAQERNKAQTEIQARQSAYQQELSLMNSFTTSGVSLIAQFTTGAYGHLEGLVQRANALFSSAPSASDVGSSIGAGLGFGGSAPSINIYADNGQRIQQELSEIFKDIF